MVVPDTLSTANARKIQLHASGLLARARRLFAA